MLRTEYVPSTAPDAGDTQVDMVWALLCLQSSGGCRQIRSHGQHMSTMRKVGQVITGTSDVEEQPTDWQGQGNGPENGNLSRIRAGVDVQKGQQDAP